MNTLSPHPDQHIDLQLRNGTIVRNTPAKRWRFGEWAGQHRHLHPHDFDVVKWQAATKQE